VLTCLGAVGFAALGLAAVFAPADPGGVLSLVGVGHLVWVAAFAIDRATPPDRVAIRDRGITAAALAVAAGFEGLGCTLAHRAGEAGQALWYGLALSFAAAGIVGSRRRCPSDPVFTCQVYFHSMMLIPLLSTVLGLIDRRLVLPGSHDQLIEGALALTLTVVACIGLPLLFTALLASVAINLTGPAERRDLPWTALLAHQAAFVVILIRWAGGGIS
jgi:hypothetical protein